MDLKALFKKPEEAFPYKKSFVFAGIHFQILSTESLAIEDIEHYIPKEPVSHMGDLSSQIDIRFIIDPVLEQSIRSDCFETGETITAKRKFTYKRLKSDDLILFASHEGDEPHSVAVDKGRYAVIGKSKNESAIRCPLRIVREIALRTLENQGGCFTHAAAVSFEEGKKGALIIGDKGAGKSTTMWQFLHNGGADFITNDRSISMLEGQELTVYGWPMCLALGVGTVQATTNIQELKNRTFSRSQDERIWDETISTEEEAKEKWASGCKFEITPKEAAEMTGATIRSSTKVDMVIFPSLKIGSGEIRLVPVKKDDQKAKDIMLANIREPEDPDYLKGWLGLRSVSDTFLEQKASELIHHLFNMPCFYLEGDPRKLQEAIPDLLNKKASSI
ncbi:MULTISPECIES: hypothetical protein [Bacillus]|uniref:Uncharacterized protein n=1 Tax=Bacillus pumilus TaxID=1408 RepID=A0A2G8IYM3_BACPU|nr:hypothetical protein [Bacillus pumilus]MCC9087165.1 hypothetical protein [Bacillus pumilus]PIK28605.1 hypothetical protein CTV99_00625 [Bacillus pumilus]